MNDPCQVLRFIQMAYTNQDITFWILGYYKLRVLYISYGKFQCCV